MPKKIVKDIAITSVEMLIRNKHKQFIIIFQKKEKVLDFNKLKNMTFDTIYNSIVDNKLFLCKIVEYEKQVYKRTVSKIELKSEIKSNCKTNIDDLINGNST